jgi:hypothetical protein
MTAASLTISSLYLFAGYHFLVGAPSVLSLSWLRKIGSLFYKLKIPEKPDPQFEYVLKPLGLYALFVSLVSFLIAREVDSDLQRYFLLICSALLIGRGLCRLSYESLFIRAFGTTAARNRGNALLTFVLGAWFIALFFLSR